MASLTRNKSSTSLNETPEYCTMRECHVALVELLKPAISSLGDVLFSKGLIPPDVKESIRESRTKADATREVIDYLNTQIKYSPAVYDEFVSVLKDQGQWTKPVVEQLEKCYNSQVEPMSAESSASEQQSTVQLQFTVPQNIKQPQKILGTLGTVKFKVLHEDQNKTARPLINTLLSAGKDNTWEMETSPTFTGHHTEDPGRSDVLLLVTKLVRYQFEVVSRRSRHPLTSLEKRKLEEQGIHEDLCFSDLSIINKRCGLDRHHSVIDTLSGERVTCVEIKERIADLMTTTHSEGVTLYYIGSGQRRTGNWYFSDGCICFKEIMDLYTQHFRGRVLTIISDCSYSGSWVREAMAFMDEQGVGPCGHVAKEKGMLVKVFASCLASEIPAELAFSTHGILSDRNTGNLVFNVETYRGNEIHDSQHPCGLDFTEIRCENKRCTMAPGSTWRRWMTGLFIAKGKDKGRDTWYFIRVRDAKAVDTGSVDVSKLGDIVRSGYGRDPPEDVRQEVTAAYQVDYNYRVE